jgi:hypothetical protein
MDAKCEHIGKPARAINARSLGDCLRHPRSARHGGDRRQEWRCDEYREQGKASSGRQSQRSKEQSHHDEACNGILEENVAIPNEEEMGATDKHQERQSPNEQRHALRVGRVNRPEIREIM